MDSATPAAVVQVALLTVGKSSNRLGEPLQLFGIGYSAGTALPTLTSVISESPSPLSFCRTLLLALGSCAGAFPFTSSTCARSNLAVALPSAQLLREPSRQRTLHTSGFLRGRFRTTCCTFQQLHSS